MIPAALALRGVRGAGKAENRALKEELKQVKRELARKEKALAEAAALLILKKKAQAIVGVDADDQRRWNNDNSSRA